jgi:hypothetical protein
MITFVVGVRQSTAPLDDEYGPPRRGTNHIFLSLNLPGLKEENGTRSLLMAYLHTR